MAAGCGVEGLDVLGAGESEDPDAGRPPPPPERGPYHVYRFDEGAGAVARDVAGRGDPLDLALTEPDAVTWLDGALRIDSDTVLASDGPPGDFLQAAMETDALTAEAWVVPEVAILEGTHRIVTVSVSRSDRNFTLGQGALSTRGPTSAWTFRLRTTGTNDNGLPAATTGEDLVDAGRLTHLVGVRDPVAGVTRLYVDGVLAGENDRRGVLDVFDLDYPLLVGNELDEQGGSRAWRGELHAVVLWARALGPDEIAARLAAGPD